MPPASWPTSATLIAKGVNAIVFNPNDPKALNPALAEAQAAGIKTVSVDALRHRPEHLEPLQQPGQVRGARRQVAVRSARRHGHRLVHPRHRRQPGRLRPRHRVQERPQGLPEHQGRPEPRWRRHRLGSGHRHQAHQRLHRQRWVRQDHTASGRRAWASRSSTRSRRTARSSCRSPTPTSAGSSTQLLDPTGFPGLKGAAVTNTAAVGGAGITLALKLLNGETVTADPPAPPSRTPSCWIRSWSTT